MSQETKWDLPNCMCGKGGNSRHAMFGRLFLRNRHLTWDLHVRQQWARERGEKFGNAACARRRSRTGKTKDWKAQNGESINTERRGWSSMWLAPGAAWAVLRMLLRRVSDIKCLWDHASHSVDNKLWGGETGRRSIRKLQRSEEVA